MICVDLKNLLKKYDSRNLTVAVLGSHSALDVCRGAKDEGFRTLVVCERGRDKTYSHWFKTREAQGTRGAQGTQKTQGCVDEVLIVDKFKDLLHEQVQSKLREKNAVFFYTCGRRGAASGC